MKKYVCPSCKEQGVNFLRKLLSSKIFPAKCGLCGAGLIKKQNIFLVFVMSVVYTVTFYVSALLILKVGNYWPFFIWFFGCFVLDAMVHWNSALISK